MSPFSSIELYFTDVPYPCAGRIVALRGYDGVELWRMRTFGTTFEINCNNIDVDRDGKLDCIATGRLGMAVAFDPRLGELFAVGFIRAKTRVQLPGDADCFRVKIAIDCITIPVIDEVIAEVRWLRRCLTENILFERKQNFLFKNDERFSVGY